ncbi:MAG: right-handed parallel beta-helix repeat-containing protein, partial [Promethearchaeota archaeon]
MLVMQKCSIPYERIFPMFSVIFLFIILSNTTNTQNLNFMEEWGDLTQFHQPEIQQSWSLSPIQIDDVATGAGAHNWSWAVSQDWCRGAGTLMDPYIIENVSIDAANGAYGISISNSIKHFIIRNCSISNAGSSTWYAGIYIYNVSNGIITENSLVDNEKGIILRYFCENNTLSWNNITGKTLSGSDYGIYIYYYGQYNSIYENRIDYVGYGVYISGTSTYNNISFNWFDTISYYPIYIASASHYTVINQNQIQTGDHHGIYIDNAQYCNLTFNQISFMQENGIYLANEADYTNLTGNTLTTINNLGIRIDNSMNCSKEINSQVPHDFTDLLKAKTEIISHHDEFKKELPKVPA